MKVIITSFIAILIAFLNSVLAYQYQTNSNYIGRVNSEYPAFKGYYN